MKYSLVLILVVTFITACASMGRGKTKNLLGCDTFVTLIETTTTGSGLTHNHTLKPEWLRHRYSEGEAQALLLEQWMQGFGVESWEELKEDSVAKIFTAQPWEALLKLKEASDEFWYYTTPENYWAALVGEEGVVLIRNCTVVGTIITVQS